MFRLTDLGHFRFPYDISNRGVVCGASGSGSGSGGWHAFTWSRAAGFTDLAPDANHSWAWAINDAGQVAGEINQERSSPLRAFRWTPPGTLELLATPPLSDESIAYDIDSNGRCAGVTEPVGEVFTSDRATLWPTPATQTYVPLQQPEAMNDHGQIVGEGSRISTALWRAGLWQPEASGATTGTAHILSLPAGAPQGEAGAINASGQIAGVAWGAQGSRAFLWTPDSPNGVAGSAVSLQTLPPLPAGPAPDSAASGINRRGVVVGRSNGRAFIYRRGMMEDLNDFIPVNSGWELLTAEAINDKGWIVGMGWKDNNSFHGYVLQPVFPLDQVIKFPPPWWQQAASLQQVTTFPNPEPPAPMGVRARESLAALLAHPASPRIRDVMVALAASDLAAALRDDDDRGAVQTAALEAAARAIKRLLREHREEAGRRR